MEKCKDEIIDIIDGIKKYRKEEKEFKYNLDIKNNTKCNGNIGMIKKNVKHMNDNEKQYLKKMIKKLNNLDICNHALEKSLINKNEIIDIIKTKKYNLIDYNYNPVSKEERILIRTKKTYKVKDNDGNISDCYMKIVLSINLNLIITVWSNRVSEEANKQATLRNRYFEQFDIINKKVRI